MKIKRFNESNNEEFVSIEDIEEFFYEWTDEELATLKIKDILILPDKRVIDKTPYVKNIDKVKNGKLVTLTLKEKPNGLNLGMVSGANVCFTNFKMLDKAINDIKRFYIHTGEPEVNYNLRNSYMGLELYFVTTGPNLSKEETSVKEIDELLGELKDIFRTSFRNITLRGNWLEIRIPQRRENEDPRSRVRRIFTDENYVPQTTQSQKIWDWKNKIREKGFDLDISGGDLQVVFKLKKL